MAPSQPELLVVENDIRLAQLVKEYLEQHAMAGQIVQLITSHKTLTNAVSHELRTPVSRLRFSLEMLERSDRAADRARHLAAMSTDIDELDEMLTDLLSYARLDRRSIQLEKAPVVLDDWLEQQVSSRVRDSGATLWVWPS